MTSVLGGSSRSWGNQLEASRPLIDKIGARNVNAGLLWLYVLMWGWAMATFLLIVIHANEPWPLALALALVATFTLFHFSLILVGACLVPDFVYYPVQPVLLYVVADAAILLCFIAFLASYIINTASSTAPLFVCWILLFCIGTNIYKLFGLARPFDRTPKEPESSAVPEITVQGVVVPEYYEYDEYEYEASATPAARKLAAALRAQKMNSMAGRPGVRGKK
jgi:hypothetical protein